MWLRAYHPPPGLGVGCGWGCGWGCGCGWGSGWDSFIIAPLTVSHFGAVLIAKLDRCTRSVADLASLIDTFSRRAGWHSSVQPSLWTPAAPAGASWSTCSAPWRSGRGKPRRSARQQRSRCSSSRAGRPAGWRLRFPVHRRAPGRHQGEQETLAAIIEHRAAGLSWAKVADKPNATGHRTRTGGQGYPGHPVDHPRAGVSSVSEMAFEVAPAEVLLVVESECWDVAAVSVLLLFGV